jgi:MraZ protein
MGNIDYFERRLDSKRRLTVPTELRKEFATGQIVVTRGFGKYLHIYREQVWQDQVEPRLMGDILDENVADINVRFRTGKQVAQMDGKQGRITLELHLLDYAGIDKDVVAVRVGPYWRLMSKDMA